MLPWAYRLYFWGVHGVFAEIIFTGIWEFVVTGKRSLMGISSIWSFFVYGFGTLIAETLYHSLRSRRVPLLARCCIYVLVTYTWEFVCGLFLDYFGARNWDYTAFEYDIMGLVTLEYAPVWFFAGLYFEFLMSILMQLEEIPSWRQRLNKDT